MKRQKTKNQKIRNKKNATQRDAVARDWQPLFAAFKDITDWAFDIGVALSHDLPEDVKAIEEVRSFVHAWLEGRACDVPLTDVLVTIGTILAAIEIDLGIDSVSVLSPLLALVDRPAELPPAFRVRRFARERAVTPHIVRLSDELANHLAA